MKTALALGFLGLGLGLAVLLGRFYDDPRDAGPAAIPERYLVLADGECRDGMAAADPAKAAAFCGCVVGWVRDHLSFRTFRTLKVELDAAAAAAGGHRSSFARAIAEHDRLGPVIAGCRAVHGL